MKKLFAIVFVLLALSACTAGEKPPNEFTAEIGIVTEVTEYRATYEKRLDSDKLRLVYPDSVSGIEFLLCDGKCTVTLGDTSFECEALKAVFDFLPIDSEGEKTVGHRNYRIFNLREVK